MAGDANPPVSSEQLSSSSYLRLVTLSAVIGIPAAFLAAVFLAFVYHVEHWLWDDLPDLLGYAAPPWFLVIGLPVVGASVVIAARLLLPGDGGHRPLDGIGGKPTPLAHGLGVALAAVGTLSFGGVLGPEAPLIALGSVVGLTVTAFVKLGQRESAVLATAGSFSAVSAVFGGPIVGGVLMLEAAIGLGAAALPVLLPGFVAAAVGYVIFVGLGSWGGLDTQAIAVPGLPPYDGTHLLDLLIAVAVGLVAAVLVFGVRRFATGVSVKGELRLTMPALLLAGGLAVGLLAQIAEWLGASYEDVLFSGQASIPAVVAEDSTRIVVILLVAKALAYAVCLGCGFRGGQVFPALFLGVALATFTVIWLDVSPTLAVAVGSAAGFAAVTRMLLTPILFAALLVGRDGLDAVPAAVLAAAAAWLAVEALHRARPSESPSPSPTGRSGG